MLNHYIGQFFICQIMTVPVVVFDVTWINIKLEYAAWTLGQEITIFVTGMLFNSLVFTFMAGFAFFCKQFLDMYPRIFYKIICWNGMFMLLDTPITLICDCLAENFVNGDYFKLYYAFKKTGVSGLIGIYFTILSTFIILVFNGGLFYQYMVYTHMNGRVIDLYKRQSGSLRAFFVPHDNEVSFKYLQWVIKRYRQGNYVIRSDSRTEVDKRFVAVETNKKKHTIQTVKIFKYEQGKIWKYRLFVKDHDGSIVEKKQLKLPMKWDEIEKLANEIYDENGPATLYGDELEFNEVVESSKLQRQATLEEIKKRQQSLILDKGGSLLFDQDGHMQEDHV